MIDKKKSEKSKYILKVPLDAAAIANVDTQQAIKVAVLHGKNKVESQTVCLSSSGKASVAFTFKSHPKSLRVIVGPGDAEDDEIVGLQTITYDVPASNWANQTSLRLTPIFITPYYWHWWLRWCRTYTIRGRVICPDGSPVPGAEVCAYDVDHWFTWTSTQKVKCVTTASDGTFEMKFRWCCGWWPWYWLRRRSWQVDDLLANRISDVLQTNPDIQLGSIGQRPSLNVFQPLLENDGLDTNIDFEKSPNVLEGFRKTILDRLPSSTIQDLNLKLWPWHPWNPWWDCSPDIIFKVKQDCFGEEKLIINETIADTRYNLATTTELTLIANDEACCIAPPCEQPPCPEGDCVVVDRVCTIPIDQIGGNQNPPLAPAGYYRPGAVPIGSANRHRPFAERVPVYKAGTMVNVDYYEILDESLNPLPIGAEMDFKRRYWDANLLAWGSETFNFQSLPGLPVGHRVVKSRERAEADSGLTWDQPGADRFWGSANRDLLVPFNSAIFADGTYRFKVRAWEMDAGGQLVNPHMLPVCGTDEDSEFVLAFDNRPAISALGHDPSHNCGDGVHICTLEPDCHIVAVRVNGSLVGTCDTVSATGGVLEIDFSVTDSEGHLAFYSLHSEYGLNSSENLLAPAKGGVLTPLNPNVEVGPRYGDALTQGAIQPHWRGGRMRLTINLDEAFPVRCCYQLVLRAYKRTIVNCNANYPHRNATKFTIGVGVCDNDNRLTLSSERLSAIDDIDFREE